MSVCLREQIDTWVNEYLDGGISVHVGECMHDK